MHIDVFYSFPFTECKSHGSYENQWELSHENELKIVMAIIMIISQMKIKEEKRFVSNRPYQQQQQQQKMRTAN